MAEWQNSYPKLHRLVAWKPGAVISGGYSDEAADSPIVQFFAHGLTEARRGDIVGVLGALRYSDGSISTGVRGEWPSFKAVGAAAVLLRDVQDKKIEGFSPNFSGAA